MTLLVRSLSNDKNKFTNERLSSDSLG